jgi:hypothetical protein
VGQKKRLFARREERRKLKISRTARSVVGNFAYVFLAGAIVFFVVVVLVATRHTSASTAVSNAAATRAAATSDAGSGWITINAESPGAIIAAARKSTLFNVDRSGDGDYLKDLSHLETPVLVRALHSAGSIVMPDYYVIPIDDTSGAIVGAAELALNPTHTAVQLTSIITYSAPRPHGKMAHTDMAAAVADLTSQRHVAVRSGAQPQLVYIPIDASQLQTGQVTWSGGGLYPADPVWLIPGADGQDHVVGTDGRDHYVSQLPLMKQP